MKSEKFIERIIRKTERILSISELRLAVDYHKKKKTVAEAVEDIKFIDSMRNVFGSAFYTNYDNK